MRASGLRTLSWKIAFQEGSERLAHAAQRLATFRTLPAFREKHRVERRAPADNQRFHRVTASKSIVRKVRRFLPANETPLLRAQLAIEFPRILRVGSARLSLSFGEIPARR